MIIVQISIGQVFKCIGLIGNAKRSNALKISTVLSLKHIKIDFKGYFYFRKLLTALESL